LTEEQIPNRDIRVSEDFLQKHEQLLTAMGRMLLGAALGTPGVVDSDIRDALQALIRTYRTLQSGLYYESTPENALAGSVYRTLQAGIAEFRREEQERLGLAATRDNDVLTILVFLERLELDRNNGRPRSRAFIDFLRGLYPAEGAESGPAPSLLVG
jgi:hypothetical protein